MLGNIGCGKTSLLLKYTDNVFNGKLPCTIGLDFKVKTVFVDRRPYKLQIWDTAGQERFQCVQQSYIRNSHACIAVYDITDRESFKCIEFQI